MKRFIVYGLFLMAGILSVSLAGTAQAKAANTQIVISAIKTDGSNTAAQPSNEYIELQNVSDVALSLDGWRVEYAGPESILKSTDCSVGDWQAVDESKTKVIDLTGTLEPQAKLSVAVTGMLDDKSGAVRVTQANDAVIVHDTVGWGTETNVSVCLESKQTTVGGDGEYLVRCVDEQGMVQDSDNNAQDFVLQKSADPRPALCTDQTETDDSSCMGIVISEVLANPAGTDAGKEYIELHNTATEPRSLDGCILKTGSNTKQFALPETTLQAGERKAYYDSQTGLTLTNNGGQALLVTPTEEMAVDYPALNNDQSWALVGDMWQLTAKATPNGANVLAAVAGGSGGDIEVPKAFAPCPAGKVRNPATNRCRSVTSVTSALTACKPGQVRNPETNRCRAVASAATATLTPCKPGQERNPATNRCRSVVSAASAQLKPCDAGEERNPETNRCRKITTVAAATNAQNAKGTSKPSSKVHYAAAGIVAAGALSYGAYEYRGDLRNRFAAWRKGSGK